MKLYEINQAIEDILSQMVDEETGEVIPDAEAFMEQLSSLELERAGILEYLAKMVLNYRAEAEALKNEETRLKERRDRLTTKEVRLVDILNRECGGENTDLGVATIRYRKTERVEVTDLETALAWFKENEHSDCYRVPTPEIAKTEVKRLLKAGANVPGVILVQDKSCSLK